MGKYIILGIIQGLTEFLPISSSAHLLWAQKILNITHQELGLCVILHLGTFFALLVFLFKDILQALKDIKLLLFIVLVTIITGIIGVAGRNFFEYLFSSFFVVPLALLMTAIILISTKNLPQTKRTDLNINDVVLLGLVQGLAIIPGISRSGITISSLLFRGIERELCFKFSFLASLPAVLGATWLELKDLNVDFNTAGLNIVVGFLFSFLSGVLSLWFLRKFIIRAKFYYFGYYCIFAALIGLLFIK